jgi:GGDEF domain-containing protein
VLGRFSGNKFGLILKNCTVDDMNCAAERSRPAFATRWCRPAPARSRSPRSIGAVSVPRYARNADEADQPRP